jgi:hypothetical protein
VYAVSRLFQTTVLHRLVHSAEILALAACLQSLSGAQTIYVDSIDGLGSITVKSNGTQHIGGVSNSSVTPFDLGGVSVTTPESLQSQRLVQEVVSADVIPTITGVLPYSIAIHNKSDLLTR